MDVCVKTDNIEVLLKKWFKFNDSSHEKGAIVKFLYKQSQKRNGSMSRKSIN